MFARQIYNTNTITCPANKAATATNPTITHNANIIANNGNDNDSDTGVRTCSRFPNRPNVDKRCQSCSHR